ncbi:MAG: DNA polymerase I [Sulfurovaceae bacterium]|nr:DNA polymerase I [Sulfurovaceae bacterium]
MPTITIIDTFGFFFRSYYALPPLRNSDGFPTGLLTGFINLIDSLRRNHSTDYIVFALDSKGDTFRNELYSQYKANRQPPPEDLTLQLPIAIEWIEKMGFASLALDRYEADDIIATITAKAKADGIKVRIISHDKDLYQLIDDGIVVLHDSVKKIDIDEAGCVAKFGIHPRDFTNFQAILGDSSDNIPGIKGIGQKGASDLINRYHTLEAIYADIENAGTPRIQKLLLESKGQAFLSRELVTMKTDLIEGCNWGNYRFEDKNYLACLKNEFEKYEMKQALKKSEIRKPEETPVCSITNNACSTIPKFEAITLDTTDKLEAIISKFTSDTIIAFDTETTDLDTKEASLVGFSFCTEESKAYYVPVAHSYLGVGEQVSLNDALKAIKKILSCKVVGQNLKFDLGLLYNRYNFQPIEPFADTMLLAWLADPGSRVGLDALAKEFFGYEMVSFKDTVKKGENFSTVTIEEATFYAAEDAWMTYLLYNALIKKMELASLDSLIKEAKAVEYPFIDVLIRMESVGIKVDLSKLQTLTSNLGTMLEDLTKEIYTLCGSEFNIRSTQQLGVVLFGQLGLKGGKKTKTGYSTNEAVLEELKDEHPVIEKLLLYREYSKLLSTYAQPLYALGKKDVNHRIYTSFLQTGTATGRLSSKDPNLQNIPVRTELGRSIRESFIAKDGYKLVGIDYSQIELRLLAHFSGDKALNDAFNNREDIHYATSHKLFGEELAKAKRNVAKSINFGLLYGMGPKKLSLALGISQTEAKDIIASYFASFPTVRNFLESIQKEIINIGYVETLLGRRRFFNYELANGMEKAAYLREGVNTVFQGSAADLIKLSMNQIDNMIIDEKLDARLLLQIHDELIFEIEASKAQELSKRFAYAMENIYELNVPLECSVSIGNNWGELK